MKKILSCLVVLIFCLPFADAQVLEETCLMPAGSKPALTIILPGADVKFVESAWKEYMKPYGKVAKVKSSKEFIADDVQILDIGGVNRMDVYSLNESAADGTKLTVWFDLGAGYISSEAYPKEYVAGVNFIKGFASKVKYDMISRELDEQKKLLTKAESNLDKLKRENDSLHKIIDDARRRIEKAEKDIEKNLQEQEAAQKDIGAQQEAVKNVQQKLDEARKEQ